MDPFQVPAIITAHAAATQAAAQITAAVPIITVAAVRTITAHAAAIRAAAAARIIPVAGPTATALTTDMRSATATALTPVQTAESLRPAIRIAVAIKQNMAAGFSRRFLCTGPAKGSLPPKQHAGRENLFSCPIVQKMFTFSTKYGHNFRIYYNHERQR